MRALLARTLVAVGLLGLGGFAWLTGHPESPVLERAARWPGIGRWAERFRAAYLQPAPPSPVPAQDRPEIEVVTIWLSDPPNQPAVDPRADGRSQFPPAAASALDQPPLGRAAEPPRPLPARPADPARLAAAERVLGGAAERTAIGPYALLADAGAAPPLERWGALAGALDAAYAERVGRVPLGEPAETVVLFAAESGYRSFQGFETRLAGVPASGHAGSGLAALWSVGRSTEEVESTLVHELVHFVSRRALGPALPPWLDEGLAEDLAQAPFDAGRGRFELGGFRVDVTRDAERAAIRGGLAALDLAARAVDGPGRLPVADLMRLEWEGFVGPEAPLRYAQAFVWVRFLYDGGDGSRAVAFRDFLAGVAAGESASGDRLLGALGEDPAALDAELAAWLRKTRALRYVAAGLPPPRSEPPAAGASGSSSRQAEPPSP